MTPPPRKHRKTRERSPVDSREVSATLFKNRLFKNKTLWFAMASSIGLCMAFPPFKLWPLAFVAPIGWLRLIRHESLMERRQFLPLYFAGFAHWMILIQWIRLPHWSAYFGWVVLSAYLACYIPAFIFATRTMVHRWRIPIVLAAPVAWTGFELARGYLFTGFSLSLLGHAVVNVDYLTQIADTFGAYGVSFLIMSVAATVERCIPLRPWGRDESQRQSSRLVGAVCWAFALMLATVLYGWTRLASDNEPSDQPGPESKSNIDVAIIQGVYDTEFDTDAEVAQRRAYQAFDDYMRISQQAIADSNRVDLVIWPESMFSTGWRHQSYVSFRPKCSGTSRFRNEYGRMAELAYRLPASQRIEFHESRCGTRRRSTRWIVETTR